MYLEIITPDKKVFEGEVMSVSFPGTDGSFQVLNDHAPLISTLGQGVIKIVKVIEKKESENRYPVDGGIVEVLNNKVTVLAESIAEA